MSKILKKDNFFSIKNESFISEKSPINNIKEKFEDDDIINNSDFLSSYNYYIYYNNNSQKKSNLPKPTYSPKNQSNLIKENEEKQEQKNDINNDFDIISKVMNNLNLDINDNKKSKFDFAQPKNDNQNSESKLDNDILLNNDFSNLEFDSIFNKENPQKTSSKFNFNEISYNIFQQNNNDNSLNISNNNNSKYYFDKSNNNESIFFNDINNNTNENEVQFKKH